MITTAEAFLKFKSRLELSQKEQEDASNRHQTIREFLRTKFASQTDFLTGSYGRNTKTKPLKDVDIFFVLADSEKGYRQQPAGVILEKLRVELASKYGEDKVSLGRRSVKVDFGVVSNDEAPEEKVMSIDVVPAFRKSEYYEIPDRTSGDWIETNPQIHAELATKANKNFSNEWKPLVKMIKKWNQVAGKPIKPSFLIEVVALELFVPPFSGGYPYEIKSFFSDFATKIERTWADPAGLGTPVSDQMTISEIAIAKSELAKAQDLINSAGLAERSGRQGEALSTWRKLFGPMFPLS